jgi:hypothetical protein
MDNEIVAFKLIQVKLKDDEIYGRPVEWDRAIENTDGTDVAGVEAVPTSYETACPQCGQRIEFPPGFSEIQCDICKAGQYVRAINAGSPYKTFDVDALLAADAPPEKKEEIPVDYEPKESVPEEPVPEESVEYEQSDEENIEKDVEGLFD